MTRDLTHATIPSTAFCERRAVGREGIGQRSSAGKGGRVKCGSIQSPRTPASAQSHSEALSHSHGVVLLDASVPLFSACLN